MHDADNRLVSACALAFLTATASGCKSTGDCPGHDEAAAVVLALGDGFSAERTTKVLYAVKAAAEKDGIRDLDAPFATAGFELRDRVDALIVGGGALARADLKRAFSSAAVKSGFTEKSADALYEANARAINAELVANFVAGGGEEHRALFERTRKCIATP